MLQIGRRAYKTMLAHLGAVFPAEGCGFLAGRAGRLTHVYPIDNQINSPTAFLMDPRQQIEALLAIEAAGLSLLAIFHSHPEGTAVLSADDLARAAYPEAIYLVAALASDGRQRPQLTDLRGYVIEKHANPAAGHSPVVNEIKLNIE